MFSHAIKLLTINGFAIKIDPSWVIIAALVTWSLAQQLFPDTVPGLNRMTYLAMAVVAMLGLFASLLLHELAHSVIARRLGVPIRSITLFVFGGVAELDAEPKSAAAEFWIAIAGPMMSLALAVGIGTLAQIARIDSAAPPVTVVLSYLATINLVLGLFNLIPAFPLDGGRVLRAYLWQRSGDVLSATRTAAQSGRFFAYGLMGLGILALFQGALVAGLWYLLIGGFVLIAAQSSYTAQLAKTAFEGKSVGAMMARKPITVNPDMTLAALVNQIMLRRAVSFLPVMEDGVLLGHIDQSVLSSIDRENWANTRVGDVFVGLEGGVMVDPDLALPDLLEIIRSTGRRKFMVVRDHELLGVITLSDLTRYLGSTLLPRPQQQEPRSS